MLISYSDYKFITDFINKPINGWITPHLPESSFTKRDDKIYLITTTGEYCLEEKITELDKDISDFIIYVCKYVESNQSMGHLDLFFRNNILTAIYNRDRSKYGYKSYINENIQRLLTNDNYRDVLSQVLCWASLSFDDIKNKYEKYKKMSKYRVVID